METSSIRRVLVTGNWENIYQGVCNELGHYRKPEDSLPLSILKDLTLFEEFLKENPKLLSIQLTSEDKFKFEYFGNLIKLIGDNCPNLECLSLLLFMNEGERNKLKKLDLEDAEVNPHTEIWEEFIKNVGPSLQHISFCGDYRIPLFIVKRLIESCPELDFVEGSSSKECAIWSASEIPNLTKERAETVTFVNLYSDRFDLNSIVSQCGQIRTFMFNWRHGKDLMLLDHENMKKLVDLDIVDRRNLNLDPSAETEEPDELERLEEAAGNDEALAADLILPFDCHLRYLTVKGVLSDETWNLLSKRAPRLQVISYTNSEPLSPYLLDEFLNIFRLRTLILNVPNTLTSEDLLPFLEKFIQNSRHHYTPLGTFLSIQLMAGRDKEEVQETVEDVLKCLHSTVVDGGEEGEVKVTLQFHEYDEGFKFEFSEEMSGIEVDMHKAGDDDEDNTFEFLIRTSKYFNARKYPRKLRVSGKQRETSVK